MTPRFIVLDGVEGCGKSTQARKLAEHLRAAGLEVLFTHEPGGTPVGEAIRQLILDPAYPEMAPLTELMLFCASRAQHCAEVIVPALQGGASVVCDRFAAATLAYQGHAGGLGMETVELVNRVATGGLEPDLLIILDADPRVGWERKFGGRDKDIADRIEQKALQFHEAVREGFLQVARSRADTAVVIDADRSPEEVFSAVIAATRKGAP